MKKIYVFLLGILTGVILTFVVSYIIAAVNSGTDSEVDSGISMFEKAGQKLEVGSPRQFEILQVLPNGTALAYMGSFGDTVVLLLPDETHSYYDDQVIKIPTNKCVRQIGTYRYPTKNETIKTVPIVRLYDK